MDYQLDQDPGTPAPLVELYRPFPTFTEWNASRADFTAFDSFAIQLFDLKESSDADTLSDAIATATRWAAANTGAIEGLFEIDRGFTYSIAVSAAAWDDIRKLKGDVAASSIEDALRAYEFVLDAATRSYPITEVWIRELHEIVSASQETYAVITAAGIQDQGLPKGVYKSQPNSPLNIGSNVVHSYASPMETKPEMQRFVAELNSDAFVAAHPVMQASYAHYAFVGIHPFADGNGRVSRALASTYLYRSPGVPLVIFADQKGDYLDALESADRGDGAKFIRFISERVIDSISMVRSQHSSAAFPDVDSQLQRLAPLLSGMGGLAHTEIDAIGLRLYEVVWAAFERQIEQNPLGQGLTAGIGQVSGDARQRPTGYRPVPDSTGMIRLMVESAAPAVAYATTNYSIAIARPGETVADFVCYSAGRVILEIDLREVHPVIGSALVFRAEAEALRELRGAVATTAQQAENSLRKAGYL